MIAEFEKTSKRFPENKEQYRQQYRCGDNGNTERVIQQLFVFYLRKPEKACFQSVCKQHVQKWNSRVHLREVARGGCIE